jgi:predicted NAD-dependent protein-ADP-ribosyltransferase YbiA (DUF1768 family)
MTQIEYILQRLSDAKFRKDLSYVVEDVEELVPSNEEDFNMLQKFGLYPAEKCQPFITKQGTPFYSLDNMSVIPLGEPQRWMKYGDFKFRQLEILYNMARMNSADADNWLKENLFQQRVDARKKQEYKAKFRGLQREDWKTIQTEWMKYCLCIKYRECLEFRSDLQKCSSKMPVEDATNTKYASNLFWGAELVELNGKKYYFGCNVLGKLLVCIRERKGKLDYHLPDDFHLFGKPILPVW